MLSILQKKRAIENCKRSKNRLFFIILSYDSNSAKETVQAKEEKTKPIEKGKHRNPCQQNIRNKLKTCTIQQNKQKLQS